jgi:N4-(beta-N-acetylglucosaminyl)-L-asparaginase
MPFSRRDFLTTAVVGSFSLGLQGQEKNPQESTKAETGTGAGKLPIIVCKHTGYAYLDDAYAFLKDGGDTLDAALRVVKGPEDDPNDDSVGLGGLPNEEGVVELDACCMHGPTRRAGSVGGVRNIKNVSLVSKAVMEHTGHVMLVGEGAERFAVAMGFPRENLLTERSRKIWMLWKEYHSTKDWWGPGLADPHWQAPETKPQSELWHRGFRHLEERAADLGIEPEFRRAAIRRVVFPPRARFIAPRSTKRARFQAAPLRADWPLNCRDASAILPLLARAVTPIRTWVRPAPSVAGKRTSRLPAPTLSSKTCGTVCLRTKLAWMRSSASRATTTTT